MCSGSEAGSYLRLTHFVYHSTLGLIVIKKGEEGWWFPTGRRFVAEWTPLHQVRRVGCCLQAPPPRPSLSLSLSLSLFLSLSLSRWVLMAGTVGVMDAERYVDRERESAREREREGEREKEVEGVRERRG